MSDGTTVMQRMRDLDWLFLGVESEVSHLHLGAVAVFEGPPPSYAELADLVAAKLPALARYRQPRTRPVARATGGPVDAQNDVRAPDRE